GHRVQVALELARILVAVRRLERHRLANDSLEYLRDRTVDRARSPAATLQHERDRAGEAVAGEGRPERHGLVQRRTETVDVGGGTDRLELAARLLRSHRVWTAERLARARKPLALTQAREAEVEQLERAAARDQDVARLHVAVQHALLVGMR